MGTVEAAGKKEGDHLLSVSKGNPYNTKLQKKCRRSFSNFQERVQTNLLEKIEISKTKMN
jgi:hypothetical protein